MSDCEVPDSEVPDRLVSNRDFSNGEFHSYPGVVRPELAVGQGRSPGAPVEIAKTHAKCVHSSRRSQLGSSVVGAAMPKLRLSDQTSKTEVASKSCSRVRNIGRSSILGAFPADTGLFFSARGRGRILIQRHDDRYAVDATKADR